MNNKQHVVSFSGGKDSTAMLLMMLERGMQVDRVIFCDTTKEFPLMYEHIDKVQEMILPLKIEVVKVDFDYYFGAHIKAKGKNKGCVGYGWPDFRNRWCTALKIAALTRLAGKNAIEYLGIALDEPHRYTKNQSKNRTIRHPLVEWGITEAQALRYCYDKGLNWNGLYEKFFRVSCFCCPLSRLGELRTIHSEFPELWQQMEEMDKKSFRTFRSGCSLDDLAQRFSREHSND